MILPHILKMVVVLILIWGKEPIAQIRVNKCGGGLVKKLKVISNIIKFLFLIFIIINIVIARTTNYCSTVMNQINFWVVGFGGFGNGIELILALCFFVLEFILIIALFIKKSKFKLISNIILEILCVADICICIFAIINNIHAFESKLGIILDLIFILLITVDIIITYKKPKMIQ